MLVTDTSINIEKAESDIGFLDSCIREVLEATGELPLIRALDEQPKVTDAAVLKLYTTYFQLLNLVEENAAAQHRRRIETRQGSAKISGLWAQALTLLKKEGLTEDQIAARLPHIRIEPVFTAHPTEAKRASVLRHLRSLYLLLVKRENQMWTTQEQETVRQEIKTLLEILWRTGDIFLEKPTVEDELRNMLYYLTQVFPQSLPALDRRMRAAWQDAGFDPARLESYQTLPQIRFGNWVGGDRDGHPFVTAKVTQRTLMELRKHALLLYHQDLITLGMHLSFSSRRNTPPPRLLKHIVQMGQAIGSESEAALARNQNEPWRQMINLMRLRLPLDVYDEIAEKSYAYQQAAELQADAMFIYETLGDIGAKQVAKAEIEPLLRKIQTFGFHLAALDIRQNSAFHDKAVSQLLAASGFDDVDFARWTEEKRLAFLNEELASPRPFVRTGTELPPEASAVLDSYQVIQHHIQRYGTEGIGAFIVSMTRSTSDLLTVYLLGREAGLVFPTSEGLICSVPVVPLFETIEDLQGSAAILDSFLQHPVARRSLIYQQKQRSALKPMQQVMVGYSDSNKDGGILASLWNVHCGQRSLTEIGAKHSVGVYFFHGRGGTVSRGGGPTHRFIESLPAGSVQGNLRLTEQGETIAQKYANHITSVYHLELLTAGTAKATLRQHSGASQPHVDPIIDRLSAMSSSHYQTLLQTPGFMEFFAKVTPIDVIESSRIGSRPARRTGQRTLADLRAIPWVFSWSQARFFLSAWYGMGTALEQLQQASPGDFEQLVRQAVAYPPFRYILTNASSAPMMTHLPIMHKYALLMEDVTTREQFMQLITSELERSRRLIEKIYGTTLEERWPRIAKMITLRQPKLQILHQYQIEKIRQWRAMKETVHAETDNVLFELLLTLNAIADGLRATG